MKISVEDYKSITAYEDALFETILVEGGVPLFFREHLERLSRAAASWKARGMKLDPPKLEQSLRDWIKEGDYALRIILKDGGLILAYKELEKLSMSGLALAQRRRDGSDPKYRFKTSDYRERLEDLGACRRAGWFENVYLDKEGRLTSCSVTNLFFSKGGILHTPRLERGVLDGIVRSVITRLFPVQEGDYTLEDLQGAEGVFLTNSLIGIKRITQVGERELPDGCSLLDEVEARYEEAKTKSRRNYLG